MKQKHSPGGAAVQIRGVRPPLYANGARVTAPLGPARIHAVHRSRYQDDLYLVEVQYDNRRGIYTYSEAEIEAASRTQAALDAAAEGPRWTPGETAHAADLGEVVVRNVVLNKARAAWDAIVQVVGTERVERIPESDLSPAIEAA